MVSQAWIQAFSSFIPKRLKMKSANCQPTRALGGVRSIVLRSPEFSLHFSDKSFFGAQPPHSCLGVAGGVGSQIKAKQPYRDFPWFFLIFSELSCLGWKTAKSLIVCSQTNITWTQPHPSPLSLPFPPSSGLGPSSTSRYVTSKLFPLWFFISDTLQHACRSLNMEWPPATSQCIVSSVSFHVLSISWLTNIFIPIFSYVLRPPWEG